MAARRKTGGGSRGASRGRRQAAAPVRRPLLTGVANDIVGLLVVIVAIAMAVSLMLPSSAPVTHVTGEILVMLFGAGALLFPAALLIFALTFFIDDERPLSGRIAFGLALITLSVLSIVSITYPGASTNLTLVLDHEILRARGGYVGGGIAWALLSTVGREVGLVVLVGSIVAGVVVCGFSISDAVTRLRSGARAAHEALRDAGEQRRVRREARRAQRAAELEARSFVAADEYVDEWEGGGASDEQRTTYLGTRTSAVLTRGGTRPQAGEPDDDRDDGPAEPRTSLLSEAVTTLLRRRDRADRSELAETSELPRADEQDAPTGTGPLPWDDPADEAVEEEPEAAAEAVPDFLARAAKAERPKRRPTKRGRKGSTTKRAAADAGARVAGAASAQGVSDANVRVRTTAAPRPGDADESYELPSFSMLSSNPKSASSASSQSELDQTMAKLQGTLREFGLTSHVVDYVSGPLVTTFRVEMGEGERVNKIRNLEDDIALTLAAEKVRIFAPIPGTSYVGIEIPNKTRQNVHLGDVLPYAKGGPLEVAIGRDSSGKPIIADIAKMPHMLVAGTTGSGKSVMINSMIMSLLMRSTPKQVRLIMVDPKRVEFKGYNGIPHLYVPVVTEPRQAASALQWAVSEMERRLKVFERAGARNITVYNDMCVNGKLAQMDNPPEPMPYLVIVIDELSDLMMVAGKDVEASIVRIAQLARAAGIHLVIATQRPSANVVTGLIKSNIDSRVALKVSSGIDSRVILDETGADRLLGNGDMLFKDRGLAPKRVLGCYTSDPEIESVVDFIRDQGEPDYHEEILSAVVPGQPGGGGGAGEDEDDPLVWEAAQIVVESQLGSTSGLQRRLKVGYARAGRIMDMLEAKGVVGPGQGSKPREVLLDEEALEDLRVQEEKYREV